MEPILLVLESWWWVAPAAAGVGAASYVGLTAKRRRARRLELDAARHEEAQTYRALAMARANLRSAQADVLAARAARSAPSGIGIDAKRRLQAAKSSEKSASLALRASRARVRASYVQYRATSSTEPLPIERLYAAHDAVNARWLAYETDVDKALSFPQMTDSRHPATIAFLRAQRAAQHLRPAAARGRIAPQEYLDYRAAVHALQSTFDEAESRIGASERIAPPRTGIWALTEWIAPRPSNSP